MAIFEANVLEALNLGCTCVGGVSITAYPGSAIFAQAVVSDISETKSIG